MRTMQFRVPIAAKIFALSLSMLALLIGLSLFTYDRVTRVSGEMEDIADYLAPLRDRVANISISILAQHVHLERIWSIYEVAPLDLDVLAHELREFEGYTTLIAEDIAAAIQSSDSAIGRVDSKAEIAELSEVKTRLGDIRKEHIDIDSQAKKNHSLCEKGHQAAYSGTTGRVGRGAEAIVAVDITV